MIRNNIHHFQAIQLTRILTLQTKVTIRTRVFSTSNDKTRPRIIKWNKINPKSSSSSPCARSSHTLTLTKSNILYLMGGEHDARTSLPTNEFLWKFDPQSNQWTNFNLQESEFTNRVAHAAAYDSIQNKIYICGGRNNQKEELNDVWCFDVDSETITKMSLQEQNSMEGRSFHQMAYYNDSLYVFGGCGASQNRLSDMMQFNLKNMSWRHLGNSLLEGRGGASLIAFDNKLAVITGFAGREMNDGQFFNLHSQKWYETTLENLQKLRPRSVCISGFLQNEIFLFGGEVDPSDRGHDGAGGFENDLIWIYEKEGVTHITETEQNKEEEWPQARGWADGAVSKDGFWIFGGLTGNDANPKRLNDLWFCSVK